MIGRQSEQKRVRELLSRAGDGTGAALILVGEPGVGKSVLLSFAAETAAELGFTVVTATGTESEAELPFAGLESILTSFQGHLDHLAAPRARALRGAMGWDVAQNDDRLAIYLGAFDLLSVASDAAPVLVLADDLHWLDGPSREAILFIARRIRDRPIAVLGSTRTERLSVLNDSAVERLVVAGLPEAEGVRLAREARTDLAPSVAGELWSGTDGNPLALAEIAPLLTRQQAEGREPLEQPLPTGPQIQRVFARRFAEMPSQTQKALLVAAASHTGATGVIRDASALFGVSDDALEPAETAGLIAISDGMIAWRHPLLRAAVYNAASGPERRGAHRALAEAGGEERLGDHRAWHLAAATLAADESVAHELELLAERARGRGALSTTAHAYRQAALITPEDEQKARRLIAAADSAAATGSSEEATTLIAEAHARTDSPLMRAQAARILARIELLRGVPDAAHDRLVTLAETVKDLDAGLAATMMAEAVVAHMASGRWTPYRRSALRALELARKVGGPAESIAGVVLGSLHLAVGETVAGLDLYSRYEDVVAHEALWNEAPEIVGMYAFSQIWLGRLEVAEPLLDAITGFARRNAMLRSLAYPLGVSAHGQFRAGRWAVAHAQATEAVSVCREIGIEAVLAANLGFLAQIEAGLGQVEAAREHGAEALTLARSRSLGAVAPHALLGLAILDLSLGDYEGVIRHIDSMEPEVAASMAEPGLAQWMPIVVEARVRNGDHAGAQAALARLEYCSQLTARPLGLAYTERCRGLMASESEFEGHFEAALEWLREVDLPFDRAWTQLCYGERLRRAHRRGAAREQLAAAADTFQSLGSRLWLGRAEAELAATGARRGRTDHASGWTALTQQEQRVAQLIIDGATYREAAVALFLSTRTIESHLRQIYRKLDVRSRTELTRKLSRSAAGESSG